MENLTFSQEEEDILNNELNKLEQMLPEKGPSVFLVSKQDGLFSGSLKIESSDVYAYGKASSAMGLFKKLKKSLITKVLIKREKSNS